MCIKVVLIDGYWFSVWVLDILFLFQRDTILDFAKNILPPLEHRLLVIGERMGKW
jgi:hypothetical protein